MSRMLTSSYTLRGFIPIPSICDYTLAPPRPHLALQYFRVVIRYSSGFQERLEILTEGVMGLIFNGNAEISRDLLCFLYKPVLYIYIQMDCIEVY